jgi:hypothetical protein
LNIEEIPEEINVHRRIYGKDSIEVDYEKLNIEEIPEEINVHRRIYGKDSIEVDYDSTGQCPFCNSRIDEFNFCACGGNLGIS